MQAQMIYFQFILAFVQSTMFFPVQPLRHTNPLEFSNYKLCSCPIPCSMFPEFSKDWSFTDQTRKHGIYELCIT